MRVAMGRVVSDDQTNVFALFSLFVFLQGVGNILVTLSDALISGPAVQERFGVAKYSGIVLLTGASSLPKLFSVPSISVASMAD